MNRQPRGASVAEMLGYVDNCLPQKDRLALETRMTADPAIKTQVAQWLSQNEAIRAAFRDPLARPVPVAGLGFAARGRVADWTPQNIKTVRESKTLERRQAPADRTIEGLRKVAAKPAPPASKPKRRRSGAARRIFEALAGALALWTAGAFLFANSQSTAFVAAGVAAYRTFAQNAARPVEIATADRGVMNKWIAPQIERALPVPDLSGAGLTLLGGRIVPGANASASFVLYENSQRERVGLYVEALDSPLATKVEVKTCGEMLCASWAAAGHGFALIGRMSDAKITELARLIGEGRLKI